MASILRSVAIVGGVLGIAVGQLGAVTTTYLSDMTGSAVSNGWGPMEKDMSNGEDLAGDGTTIRLGGVAYAKGLGAHAVSSITYTLGGTCTNLSAVIGIDDEMGNQGSAVFKVLGDGVTKYTSATLGGALPGQSVSVDITGVNTLTLQTSDAGDGNAQDHTDWADAKVTCTTPQPPPACPAGALQLTTANNIQTAVTNNPNGTTFCLAAGIYRNQSVTPKPNQVFIGSTGTVLSGAKLVTTWTVSGTRWFAGGQTQGGAGVSTGQCQTNPAFPRCGYPEDLYIDQVFQKPVTSIAAVVPGTFFFDYAADRIYIAVNPSGHTIESNTTTYAFQGTAAGVHLSNLTIEKYANAAQTGALNGVSSSGWVVQNVEARWNHGIGVRVGPTMQLLDSHVHHNGQMGVGGGGATVLVQNTEIDHNNTAGFSAGWEAGGTKFVGTTGLVVRGSFVHHNNGPGLWTDIDNNTVLYENNRVEDNTSADGSVAAGIFHEISYSAIIRNNTVKRNGAGSPGWIWGAGILIAASGGTGVEIYGNTLDGNTHGISLVQQARGSGSLGAHLVQNVNVHDNTLTMSVPGSLTGAVQDTGDNGIFTTRNNRFVMNHYILSTGNHFAWNNGERTDAEWRGFGQDVNGTFVR